MWHCIVQWKFTNIWEECTTSIMKSKSKPSRVLKHQWTSIGLHSVASQRIQLSKMNNVSCIASLLFIVSTWLRPQKEGPWMVETSALEISPSLPTVMFPSTLLAYVIQCKVFITLPRPWEEICGWRRWQWPSWDLNQAPPKYKSRALLLH
jgi:hypothetical protein